jgi:nicotinamide-nucleotide amidase
VTVPAGRLTATGGPASEAIAAMRSAGQTVAVAESLTGGLVCSTLVAVPGASTAVRGGVVAYATELKQELLGVDGSLLADHGPVDPDVAREMALGVRARLRATWGLATTGVAGPDHQDGAPPGLVFVAVAGPEDVLVRRLELLGGRDEVREGARDAVIELLLERLGVSAGTG